MRKKLDYNDIVRRKWPAPFRNGIRFYGPSLGLYIITIEGQVEITSKMLEQIKEYGLSFNSVSSSIGYDTQGVDTLSAFAMTTITFREYQSPSLKNNGKRDRQILKKMKPRRAGHEPQESVHSGNTVSPDNDQGDVSR